MIDSLPGTETSDWPDSPACGFGTACLLGAAHLLTGAAIFVDPGLLSSYAMRMNALHDSGEYYRCLTGVFAFTDGLLGNIWTGCFAAAFAMETTPRLGKLQTVLFYLACGVFACALWGLGFVLAGERVCAGAPLQTSAAATGLGIFVVSNGPSRKLRLFGSLPVFAWAGLVAYLGVSSLFFWKENWSVLLPAHLAAGAFALMVERIHAGSSRGQRELLHHVQRGNLNVADESNLLRPSESNDSAVRNDAAAVSDDSAIEDTLLRLKLDEILEKITDYGSDSLNDQERELLQKASEHLRKRRQ